MVLGDAFSSELFTFDYLPAVVPPNVG